MYKFFSHFFLMYFIDEAFVSMIAGKKLTIYLSSNFIANAILCVVAFGSFIQEIFYLSVFFGSPNNLTSKL